MHARVSLRVRPLGLALGLALAYPVAHGLPQGAQVVQGQVVLSTPQAGQGLIQQTTDKAVINWQSFSIGANEGLRIVQPGVNSVLLNRVVGGDPSLILGRLESNGQVFLLNPRGIVFGRGSQVNVGGLVASTLDLSDVAFMAGDYRFKAGPGAGGLQADGSIAAPGGTVVLLAPQLSVAGSIEARRVGLAAAGTVQVDVEGDGLVLFNLRNDDHLDASLKFSGRILAEGGSAELRAQARAGAVGQVLNMDGVVQARGLRAQGGRIVIDGGTAGDTFVNGTLDATGVTGGSVSVLGQRVALLDAAVLDASGRDGGGALQVGGGLHGEGTAYNAERTYIGAGAQLHADAIERGDGGSVAVWADLRTDMLGRISARGGRLGGNGGFVETSGKQQLNLPSGSVDVSAPKGRAGQWLLDPANLTISNTTSSGTTAADPFEPTADGAVLSVTVLNNALAAGTGVTVQTNAGVGTSAESGDLIVDAAIQGTNGGSLTLNAVGSLSFTGNGSITATNSPLAVNLLAGAGVSASGVTTLGGALTVTAAGPVLLGSISSGALSITSNGGSVTLPTGTLAGLLSVTTGGGAITQAAGTLSAAGVSLDAGAGNITLGNLGSSAALGLTTTTGNILQAASTQVSATGLTTLTTTTGSITLDAPGNSLQGRVDASGGAMTLTHAGNLLLGNVTVSSLAISAGSGNIAQDATTHLDVSAASSFTTTGLITLGEASNSLRGAVTLSGGATTLTHAGNLLLGNVTASSLAISAGSGNITQDATTHLDVSAASSFTTTGLITLGEAANSLRGAVTLSGGATTLTHAGNLLLGNVTASSLAISAGSGNIAQDATTHLDVNGASSFTTTGSITLGEASNSLRGAVTLSGGATTLTNAGNLLLGSVTTSSLAISAGSGNITQDATTHLDVNAASSFTTTGSITLGEANSLRGAITLSGGATTLTNAGDLLLSNLTASSLAISAGSGNIAQDATTHLDVNAASSFSTTGSITLGEANSLRGAVTLSGGATTLTNAGNLLLGSVTTSSLAVSAGSGNIAQDATTHLDVNGASSFTTTGLITLGEAANSLRGAVTLSGGATTLTNAGNLLLGSMTASSLAISAGSGNITQDATTHLDVNAASSFTTAGLITLGEAANILRGAVTLSGGATTLTNAGNLLLGNVTASSLAISAGSGNIAQDATTHLDVNGASSFTTTGSITLSEANSLRGAVTLSGGATTLTNAGNLLLGSVTASSLSVTAQGGGIAQDAGTHLAVGTGGSSFTAGGAIVLDALTNNLQGTTGASGGATTLTSSALRLGTVNVDSLTATARSGDITQATSTQLTVSGTTDLTASGLITLGLATNSLQGAVRTSGGATTLNNATTLTLGNATLASLTATAVTGDILQAAGTHLSVTGASNLTVGNGGAITLTATNNDLQGAVAVSGGSASLVNANTLTLGASNVGALTARSVGGDLLQAAGTALVVSGVTDLTAANGAITLTGTGNDLQGRVNAQGGATTLRSAGLQLGTVDVASLLATAASGSLTQFAGTHAVVAGTTGLTASSGAITLGAATNSLQGAVTASSNGATTLVNAGSLVLGNVTASALTATAGGASGSLTQDTGTHLAIGTGGSSFTAGGAITLGASTNNLQGTVTAQGGATTLISSALRLGGSHVASLDATATSGSLTQAAGTSLVVDGASSLTASSGAITLNEAGNDLQGRVNASGGATTLRSAALTLGDLGVSALTATATTGNIAQATGTTIAVGGVATLTASNGGVTLGAFGTTGAGANLGITAGSGGVVLGTGSIVGTLGVSTSGNITQAAGGVTVGGLTTLNAGSTGDVQLTDSHNHWTGVSVTAKSLNLAAAGNLAVQGLTLATNQSLTLAAQGNLTLTTPDIDLGSGDLSLTSLGGSFTAAGKLTGRNIALTAASGLTLNDNVTAGGTLALTTASGGIAQAGGRISATGATTVDAGASTILLTRTANDFRGAVGLRGGATQIVNSGALTLGTLATGNLTVTSHGDLDLGQGQVTGTLNAQSDNHVIRQTGALTLTGATTLNAGTAALTLDNAANSLQGDITATGAAVSLRSAGNLRLAALTQVANQALTLDAGGTLTLTGTAQNLDTGSAALTLISRGGALNTVGTLKGGNVSLRGVSVGLGHDVTASGTLSVQGTNGAISQTAGSLVVSGASAFDAGSQAVTLNGTLNDFRGAVTLTGGATQIYSRNSLQIAGVTTGVLRAEAGNGTLQLGAGNVGGNLVAKATGAITQTGGGLAVTGTAGFDAGSSAITLTAADNVWGGAVSLAGGATQLHGDGAITLGSVGVASLALQSSGAVAQGVSGITVNGALGVDAGASTITLANAANVLGGPVTLTGGATQVRTAGALTLRTLATGALTAQSAGALNLGQGNVGGNLSATSGNGAVTQAGALHVTGTSALQAGTGSITLAQAGNQWGGALSLAGGAAQVNGSGALVLGTLAVTGLTVDTSGALNLGQGTIGAGGLTAASHGGAITQTGALDVTGAANLQAAAGAITLTDAGNHWRGPVTLTGGATQLRTAGALTLGTLATGDLTVTSTGALNLGQGSVSGDLVASSGGAAITQTGALQVSGDAQFTAAGADITLTHTGNRFTGALSLLGNAVAIFNDLSLNLGTLSFNSLDATSNRGIVLGHGTLSGSLTAHALGGTITQIAGGLSVGGTSTLQALGGITLADAANQFNGLVNLSGGDSAVTSAGALRLGTLATGALTLQSGGALDLGAGSVAALTATSAGAITQTGALTVGGAAALTAGGAITLNQAANSFAAAVDLHGGDTLVNATGALRLGSVGVGSLTASSTGALQLGTGTVAGPLNATSGGALTQAAGGLSVAGTAQLLAGSATLTLADAANAFGGAVSLQGGDTRLASSGALQLGSVAVHDLTLNAGGNVDLGGGTVGGALAVTTRGAAIGQSAALSVGGTASFVADGGAVGLALAQPANQWLGAVSVQGSNGGSFTSANLAGTTDLSFSGDAQALTLNSGGRLTLGGGRSTTLTAGARTGIQATGALQVSGLTTLVANGGAAMAVDLATAGAANDFNQLQLTAQSGGSFGRVQLRDGDARHDGLHVGGNAASLEVTSAGALEFLGGGYDSLRADTSANGAAITQSGALTVTGLTTLNAGSGAITLTRADNLLPSLTITSAGMAALVSGGDYAVSASQVATQLNLGGAGAISLLGPLSGSGELLMSGTGTLTIATAQGYGGGTRIAAGRVVLQGPAASAGSGAVQLGAQGQLDLRDGAALSTELVSQGGQVLNTSGTGTLAGPVTLQALTTFLPAASAGGLTISGAVRGDQGLRLADAGVLTLTGASSHAGVTDIMAGTLRANGAGSLSAASAVLLNAGATLALGHDQTAGSLGGAGRVDLGSYVLGVGADGTSTTFAGTLAGSGGLTKLGGGTFTLSGSGAHTGATQVQAGNLVLASTTALNASTAVTLAAGATLTVQQSSSLGSLAGAGTVSVQAPLLSVGANGASTRFDGTLAGSGGLAKLGAGTFLLAGPNTLAGDVQVGAGTLQLLGGSVLPATTAIGVAGGATLELLSDQRLAALTGSGRVLLNPYTLTLGASGLDGRFDGVIAGTGSLVKAGAGTLTLGGRNLYTGQTRVQGGTLQLAAAQALAGATALQVDAGARVQADADQAVAALNGAGSLVLNGGNLAAGSDGSDARFDGAISGSGGLVKQGSGALTLTAANTQGGATSIEAGTLRLSGAGTLGSGDIRNQGQLSLERSDALTLAQAISGSGSLVIRQGDVTLASAANSYTGATQVLGGSLVTTAAERLPDASAVTVAAGAQLQLGGNETVASLNAAGGVRLAGNLTTRAEQVYTGSLTLANAAGLTLSGTLIDASRSTNQFGGTPLGLSGGQALVKVGESLQLGDVSLSGGGRIEAGRLALNGRMQLTGGSLALVATAAPDDAKATPQGTAQVPVAGVALAVAEATVQQGSGGAITVAQGAALSVQASGGGSVVLAQDANNFAGQLSVLSGPAYGTAWVPNVKGSLGVQSMVHLAGHQIVIGGSGVEADMVYIRADQLATAGDSRLIARLPFDEFLLGRSLSAPAMTLELAAGAFGIAGAFGAIAGQPINVEVGSTITGGRTSGPNAGYLTVLPKAGAQGATVIVLAGPEVGSAVGGGAPYRFFHDGAAQAIEIPVVYNGVLPLTPAASGALSSINGDAEDARRARFQETVRTENVTVRLRSGVIAEVGPGRPSTQGSEGARPPSSCDPATQPPLSCK